MAELFKKKDIYLHALLQTMSQQSRTIRTIVDRRCILLSDQRELVLISDQGEIV